MEQVHNESADNCTPGRMNPLQERPVQGSMYSGLQSQICTTHNESTIYRDVQKQNRRMQDSTPAGADDIFYCGKSRHCQVYVTPHRQWRHNEVDKKARHASPLTPIYSWSAQKTMGRQVEGGVEKFVG